MANRPRRSAPQPPAGHPQLMVSADQLHEEINERLTRGPDLVDRSTGDENALKERRHEYYTWTEYNEALLRRSLDIAQLVDEYARRPGIAVISSAPDPLPVQWTKLHEDIRGKTRRLRSLQEHLPLFSRHPDATLTAPAPQGVPRH